MEDPSEENNHHPQNHLGFSSVKFPLVKSTNSLIVLQGYVPTVKLSFV